MKKILSVSIVMFAFVAATFGQVSANATATATIVTPIAIVNASNMNFGNVAVSAVAGTVILAPCRNTYSHRWCYPSGCRQEQLLLPHSRLQETSVPPILLLFLPEQIQLPTEPTT